MVASRTLWPSWNARLRRQLVGQSMRQVGDRFGKAHPQPRKPQYIGAPLRIVHVLRERQALPCFGSVSIHRIHGAPLRGWPAAQLQNFNPGAVVMVPVEARLKLGLSPSDIMTLPLRNCLPDPKNASFGHFRIQNWPLEGQNRPAPFARMRTQGEQG